MFLLFSSLSIPTLSLSYVLSFHFISSVCSIKVAFLMPHSVFFATYFGFAVCHACAKRKTNNTFETRTRIMKVVRMNHHSILTMGHDWDDTEWKLTHSFNTMFYRHSFTCQLWWNWGTLFCVCYWIDCVIWLGMHANVHHSDLYINSTQIFLYCIHIVMIIIMSITATCNGSDCLPHE